MRRLLLSYLIIIFSGFWTAANAASLIMVEQKFCQYCAAWNAEVGVIYNKTEEGKQAPLRRVDIHDTMPADLDFIGGVIFTPTFILVDGNKEIGRIRGYASEDFFWGLLQNLLEKLPDKEKHGMVNITNIQLAHTQQGTGARNKKEQAHD